MYPPSHTTNISIFLNSAANMVGKQTNLCCKCGKFFNSSNSLYVHGRRSHDVRFSSLSEKQKKTKTTEKKRKNRNKYRGKVQRQNLLKSDKVLQCSFILNSGERCRKRNVSSDRCKNHQKIKMDQFQKFVEYSEGAHKNFLNDPHLKSIKDLRLVIKRSALLNVWNEKTSTVISSGNGLFAFNSFQENDFITQYSGKTLVKRPADMSYAYGCPKTWNFNIIDGLRKPEVGQGVGSFANRASDQNKQQVNARFFDCNATQTVWLKATRFIYAGEEIYIRYGAGHSL